MDNINPIMKTDYPDPDVIRVDDTYYMVSTTMHFMPGGVILRSYDLMHWEIVSYVFDELDGTPGQKLQGREQIYGGGMWAASLRYHKGKFYVCFVANDTYRTYLYQADNICGPWKKQYVEGFYHDCSLLFDDDDRVYIMYGNRNIYLTELNEQLTGPKEGGLHRLVVSDDGDVRLGYEGSHIYKICGKYYAFFIHWPCAGNDRRTQACFVADSLEGEFRGCDVLDDDMGYWNQGVAQGGIIDTPDGDWYAVLFQDCGAVGRIPVLVPIKWENDFPIFGQNGKVPESITMKSLRPDYTYAPLFESDDFRYAAGEPLKKVWQWNHTPDSRLWSVQEPPGALTVRTGKTCSSLIYAKNTLTQRMSFPRCEAYVTVDASGLQEGDYAGICALQACYGMAAITREQGRLYLVMKARDTDDKSLEAMEEDFGPGTEYARILWEGKEACLRISADFSDKKDTVRFYYRKDGQWEMIGVPHKLYFKMDHFTGCRIGLFVYSTKQPGGTASFRSFVYEREKN